VKHDGARCETSLASPRVTTWSAHRRIYDRVVSDPAWRAVVAQTDPSVHMEAPELTARTLEEALRLSRAVATARTTRTCARLDITSAHRVSREPVCSRPWGRKAERGGQSPNGGSGA
jgi:hypothetical protein